MELTLDIKHKVLEGIRQDRANYKSDAQHAKVLGISSSVYTALKQGNIEKQLSEANWVSIARRLGISLSPEREWKAVVTDTYMYLTQALEGCQELSVSGILCDLPNIGKTYTAMHYVKTHPNAVYIDCSQVKTKSLLITKIAKEFGCNSRGRLCDIYEELIKCLKKADKPLIILDEAGDLKNEAFIEIKALWNAVNTPHPHCGLYLMGADGLQAKIERNIEYRTVGYAEIFSRIGEKFPKVVDMGKKEREEYLLRQVMLVAKANAPEGADYKAIARRAGGLRRVYTEIMKLRYSYGRGD